MNFISKKVSVLFFLFFIQASFAQPWMQNIKSENPTFKEIQNAFYEYWNDKPVEKGKGYKPFKRWEWFTENRLLPNGDFPSPSITWDEYHKYYQNYNSTHKNQSSQSQANWTISGPSTSPGGYNGLGRVNCVAFHPSIPNTFWVGTPAGGLWKTTNGGTSWTTNTDNLPVLGVSDIAIDPTNTNIMYIATGDGDALNTKSIGILKSTDGGTTWNTTGLSWNVTSSKRISRLMLNPNDPQILLVAANDGIWRTTNGGTSWTNVQTGYFKDIEFKPGDPSTVYSTTYSSSGSARIYRSLNAGLTWSIISTLTTVKRIDLAVTPANPNLVQALCVKTDDGLDSIWKSENSGASFSIVYSGNCTNNLLHSSYNGSGCGGQGWYDLSFAINPNNANDIWVGGINTWNSKDGGNSWTLKSIWSNNLNPNNVPIVHADKHFMAFHPLLANTFYECNDGGIYRSTNGGTSWSDISNGLQISQMYRICSAQTVNNRVITGLQDNGSKEFNNNIWTDRTGGDGMKCIIDYNNPSIQYSSIQNGKIYRTTNSWSSTSTISNNIPGIPTGAWVTPFAMDPNNSNTLVAGYDKVFRSINQGTTWTAISPTLAGGTNLTSIAIAPSDSETIYAATSNNIYVTTNGGGHWTTVPFSISGASITSIAVSPLDSEKIYVTRSGYSSGNKVFMSPNAGQTWVNYSGTLPNVPANCIIYQKNTNEALYVGTDIGVFYINGQMTDWVPFQNGLPNVIVNDLDIAYNYNKIWAGTYGRGLWSSSLYNPLSNENFEKHQLTVSPNPSNGLFTITLKDVNKYDVLVFDTQGKKLHEEKSNKIPSKVIDLNHLPAGIYLMKIIIENKIYNKKIIII